MALKKKAAKQGVWISIVRLCTNLVDFIVFAYLARVLSLADFGLVAFCMLFIQFANIAVNAGVNQNIIQRKTWDEQYASSTLIYVFGLACFVALALVFVGAPIAYFSYSDTAAFVIISLAPITIIMSLQSVYNGKLARDFKHKQMGFAKLFASILSGLLIFILAEHGYGLWSLVLGRLLLAILELTFMSFIAGFIPKFHFNKEHNKELRTFCIPLLGSALLSMLNQKASVLFTGMVLGPAQFALLNAAKRGEAMINQVTMSSINSMVVPSFSRVKESANLGDLYIKLVVLTASIIMPVFMGLAAIADPFVTILFGVKFSESASFMTISAFGMFMSIVAWFLPTLLISQARTADAFKLNIVNIITHVVVASATIWFGIDVMLISIVVAGILVMPLRFKIVTKHVAINVKKLTMRILPPYINALLMFVFVLTCKAYLTAIIDNDIILLFILVILGCVFYPVTSIVFFKKHTKRQLQELKEMFGRKEKSS